MTLPTILVGFAVGMATFAVLLYLLYVVRPSLARRRNELHKHRFEIAYTGEEMAIEETAYASAILNRGSLFYLCVDCGETRPHKLSGPVWRAKDNVTLKVS